MYPILFSVGKVNFYSYGLMAALAFFAMSGIVIYLSKKENLYSTNLFDKLILLFLAALAGARISFFVVYHEQFSRWTDIFMFWQGGMISYGGIVGVIVLAMFMFRKNILAWLDILSVGFLAGLFFWRMGCFLAGDHPQIVSNAFYAIQGEFPAILLESLLGLLGFVLFYIIYTKFTQKIGMIFFEVLIYYGLARILVDHFRIDAMILGFRSGQIAGIALAIAGVIGIIVLRNRKQVNNR